ncbi:hypothetical protein L1987_15045 [Smallanthus sonchifolius]|uniref:Uncharacterized protein n=1 Tax=Smallanthus sonchifolius TaxID=185202 RepID=A0ACB9J4F0_9ASTR|nr:hypothetical protein L1987_15045 [Smallanthus sonchifolius]
MEHYYENNYQGHRFAQRDHYVNLWCEAIIARIGSHRPKNLECVVYDRLGEVVLETPELETLIDEVQVIVREGEAQVPPPGKYSAHDFNSDEVYTESMQDHEIPCESLHLSGENDSLQVIRDEDTIKEEQKKVHEIMSTQWHLFTKAELLHLLDESRRLTDKLTSLRIARENAAPEPETLTEE